MVPKPSTETCSNTLLTSINSLASSRPLGQTLGAFEGWTALERLRAAYPFTCRHMTDAAKAHTRNATGKRHIGACVHGARARHARRIE